MDSQKKRGRRNCPLVPITFEQIAFPLVLVHASFASSVPRTTLLETRSRTIDNLGLPHAFKKGVTERGTIVIIEI